MKDRKSSFRKTNLSQFQQIFGSNSRVIQSSKHLQCTPSKLLFAHMQPASYTDKAKNHPYARLYQKKK